MPKKETIQSAGSNPRPPLTRELILRTALAVIDQEGLSALSMRSLGTRLQVKAMSLYNHVQNKNDILGGVLDLIVREIAVPGGDSDWRGALESYALSAREVLKKHPWAAGLMNSLPVSGPERLHYYDAVIGTFRRAGFSLEQAIRGFSLIDSYIYGFALQQSFFESGRAGTSKDFDEKELITEFQKNMTGDSYPHLRNMTEWAMEHGYDPEEDFRFGINLILSGFERILL